MAVGGDHVLGGGCHAGAIAAGADVWTGGAGSGAFEASSRLACSLVDEFGSVVFSAVADSMVLPSILSITALSRYLNMKVA